MNEPKIAVACFGLPGCEPEIEGWQDSLKVTTYPNWEIFTNIAELTVPRQRNVLIDRAKAAGHRYICFLDSDARIIEPEWLDFIAQAIYRPNFGAVSPLEVKHEKDLEAYQRDPFRYIQVFIPAPHEVVEMPWIGAYCLLMDIESGVRFDEDCPGAKGMEDLIACMQLWRAGRKVLRDNRIAVYHPYRPHTHESKTKELQWFEEQKKYVKDKYGLDLDASSSEEQVWNGILGGRNSRNTAAG